MESMLLTPMEPSTIDIRMLSSYPGQKSQMPQSKDHAGSDDKYGFNEDADQIQDPVPESQLQYEQPVLPTSAIVGVANRFDQRPHCQSRVSS